MTGPRLTVGRIARSCCARHVAARGITSTSRVRKVTEFPMPAMSPTMQSGKISSWKVKQGDTFAAGDVLLTVETDKAEVDVEAQDDGIVGKIMYDEKESSIDVGKIIALMAEEGDDISNLEVPQSAQPSSSSSPSSDRSAEAGGSSKDAITGTNAQKDPSEGDDTVQPKSSEHATSSSSTPNPPQQPGQGSHSEHSAPTHSRTILPSVFRLLSENGIRDASVIKGTGRRGQILKGDVLKHLGKIDHAEGTAQKLKTYSELNTLPHKKGDTDGKPDKKPATSSEPMTGDEFRRWIRSGLAAQISGPARREMPMSRVQFDDILGSYKSSSGLGTATSQRASPAASQSTSKDPWDALLGL